MQLEGPGDFRTMARRPFLISLSCMSVLFWPSGSKGKLSRNPDCTGKQCD